MRTFSLTEGTSDKFWHIEVADDTVTVHYGRHGTKGQLKATQYATAAAAAAEAEKLIKAKTRKGYQEYQADGETMPSAPVRAAAPAARTTKPAAAESAVTESARTDSAVAGSAVKAVPVSPAADAKPIRPVAEEGGASTASRPLAPAPGTAGSTADPDDLGVELGRLEEAALGWGRPLDSYLPGDSFNLKATEAWVKQHSFKYHQWRESDVLFDVPPFDGIPTPEQAQWWRWWYLGIKAEQWRSVGLRERLAMVRAGVEGDEPLPKRSLDYLHVDDLVVAAADLALSTADALLPNHLTQDGRVLRLLGARAAVVPQLSQASIAPALARARQEPDDRKRMRQLALLADSQEYAELLAGLPDAALAAPRLKQQHRYGMVFDVWTHTAELLAPLPDQAAALAVFDRIRPAADWLGPGGSKVYDHDDFVLALPLLLGILGSEVLPYTSELVLALTNQQAAAGLVRRLSSRVNGPAAVPTLVRLARDSRAPEAARSWLVAHPASLAGTSASFTDRDTDLLAGVLREILSTQPDAFAGGVANPTIAGLVATLQQQAATPAIELGQEPDWWLAAVEAEAAAPAPESGKGKLPFPTTLPKYASAGTLPAVVIDEQRLSPSMIEAVVWSAIHGANDPDLIARPLVAAVRERLGRAGRDELGLALLDGWLSNGAAAKERAVFVAAGYLGADALVHRLTQLVRDWPGESQHQRAVLGLNVLAATGTKVALQAISGIAGKSKFKGVQEAAKRAMATLAASQGLTADQLADQVVPDGGLDDRGCRVFDYGPRQFRVTLSPHGKLVVRDLDPDGTPVGKPRTALPAPNSKDDADLAATAKAEFSLLRKQLGDLAKIQTARLEQAMVIGRTWSGAEHREYLLGNPLLNSLIRPLIWEVNERPDRHLVRVTEEREYLTAEEDDLDLPDSAQVRLAHPLNLSESERAEWQQHLADYDLISPVEQLDRAVFVRPAGLAGQQLPPELLPKGSIHPGSLVGILERNGWRRGNPADAGVVAFCWIAFPEVGQAVVIDIEQGLWTGMIAESGDQQVTGALLVTPDIPPKLWYLSEVKQSIDWSEVNPLVFSEVQRTFAALAEKME